MNTTLRALTVALAIAGAALAAPALADATTYCINAGAACPVGGQERVDLQIAMDQAAAESSDDTILLGDKLTPYFGPFTYAGAIRGGGNRLIVKGVGGRPSLTGPSGPPVLDFGNGSLENIEILADFGDGQAAKVEDAHLEDVKVTGPPALSPDAHGITALASTLEDVEVTGGFEQGLTAGGSFIGDDTVARRLKVHGGPLVGIAVPHLSSFELDDSRVSARSLGISSSGFADIHRSVITSSNPDSNALEQSLSDGGYDLDHVTLAHTGSPAGTDSAFKLEAETPLDTHLHAVAIAGYTRGFRRVDVNGSPENLVISDSVWDPANDELIGHGSGVLVESRNVHAAAEVANLKGGDLHLRAGSAAIDRDQVSDLAQFTDLEGTSALDGDGDGIVRPDAGAFEFKPAPAPAGGGDAAGGGAGGGAGGTAPADTTAPKLGKLRLLGARTGKLKLAFVASEASKIRIVPSRVARGKLVKGRAIVRSVAAGKGAIALGKALRRQKLLRPGRLRLAVTATDAAGNRSAKRALRLQLTR